MIFLEVPPEQTAQIFVLQYQMSIQAEKKHNAGGMIRLAARANIWVVLISSVGPSLPAGPHATLCRFGCKQADLNVRRSQGKPSRQELSCSSARQLSLCACRGIWRHATFFKTPPRSVCLINHRRDCLMRNGESGSDNLLCNQTLFCSPIMRGTEDFCLSKRPGREHDMSKCNMD